MNPSRSSRTGCQRPSARSRRPDKLANSPSGTARLPHATSEPGARPPVARPRSGAKNANHAQANARALTFTMTADEVQALGSATRAWRD